MKTIREISFFLGFTKNSMYVMFSRGSSIRVVFIVFLEEEGVGRFRVIGYFRMGLGFLVW